MRRCTFPSMKRIYYILIGIVVIAIVASVLVLQAFNQQPKFKGYVFNPPLNTSDFVLYDQNNQSIELNQFYGKVIAMSFVYVNCPNVCPVIIRNFVTVAKTLNSEGYSNQYVMLLISVDPERDKYQAKAYLESLGAPSNIHYLVGPESTLKSVWYAYGILVEKDGNGTNYTVTHTAIVFLIDKELRRVVSFGNPTIIASQWTPNDLLNDMLILIRQ